MAIEIRRVTMEEVRAYAHVLELAAGRAPTEEAVSDVVASAGAGALVGAFEDGQVVGGSGYEVLELTTPGGVLTPTARILLTAVLPTHRRRGLALAMMREQIRELREQGVPLAVFTTTGPGIYEACGFSPATVAQAMTLDPAAVAVRRHDDGGTITLVNGCEAAATIADVFDQHRRVQPGQVLRTPAFWRLWRDDRPFLRPDGAGPRFVAMANDKGGRPQGYLSYRLVAGPLREQPVRRLEVEDLVAVTDAARAALWEYAATFRQAGAVHAPNVAPDDPLPWLVRDPRSIAFTAARPFLWLRLVHLQQALTARRYASPGTLVLEVEDASCPANAGRYRLEAPAAAGQAGCERTQDEPDLVIDTAALASAYLGQTTFTTLVRAGRVDPRTPGAISTADALFASRPAPWTVTDW